MDRLPYVLPEQLQRIQDVLLAVAEVAAKGKIYYGFPVFYSIR